MDNSNIVQLMPSLIQPPADVMEENEYLVATMQCLLHPMPVTEKALKKDPHKYLSWLHLVLTEFHAAQNTPTLQNVQYEVPNKPSPKLVFGSI